MAVVPECWCTVVFAQGRRIRLRVFFLSLQPLLLRRRHEFPAFLPSSVVAHLRKVSRLWVP